MTMTRRELLAAGLGTATALSRGSTRGEEAPAAERTPLGVVIHSFGVRLAEDRGTSGAGRFADAPAFLDYCHGLGARGVQVSIGARPDDDCDRLREKAAGY